MNLLVDTVNFSNLEVRDGIRYLINEKTPFSGVAVKTSETGEITRLKSYKDGKFDGESLSFYNNGQVREKESYKNGKKHGEFIIYFDNGTVKYRSIYENGKLIGK